MWISAALADHLLLPKNEVPNQLGIMHGVITAFVLVMSARGLRFP
jgi:hypothetical protein